MRFMMMVIPKGCEAAPPVVTRLTEYNRSLQKAGVLLAVDGLFPPSTGERVSYADGKATVTDGASAGADGACHLLTCGYWIIQVRSREEAIEWAKRAPMRNHELIEVRQIHEGFE